LYSPIIILENPKYAGNVGMVCRLISNFDLSPLRIIGNIPEQSYEMEWMASGAKEEIDKIIIFKKASECFKDLDLVLGTGMIETEKRGKIILPLDMLSILKNQTPKNFGIVFGREDNGITRESIALCDFMINFDLPGRQKSMNLSHSVSYVLSLLYNSSERFKDEKENEISEELKIKFYEISEKTFDLLGMNQFKGRDDLALSRWKRILNSRPVSPGDLEFLLKFFKNIERLNSKKENQNGRD
jgi:tRNA/rRNA methyltransferase